MKSAQIYQANQLLSGNNDLPFQKHTFEVHNLDAAKEMINTMTKKIRIQTKTK